MTAVVALRKRFGKKIKTVMAADSLFSAGDMRLNGTDTCKIVKFPNFIVGFAGICTVQIILKRLAKNRKFTKNSFMVMKDIFHANKFAKRVFTELDDLLVESGEEDHLRSYVGELIIVTDKKIFRTDKYGFASEFDDYTSIGCANEVLAGAVIALYDKVETEEELTSLAEKVIEIACECSLSCGPPVTVIEYE